VSIYYDCGKSAGVTVCGRLYMAKFHYAPSSDGEVSGKSPGSRRNGIWAIAHKGVCCFKFIALAQMFSQMSLSTFETSKTVNVPGQNRRTEYSSTCISSTVV